MIRSAQVGVLAPGPTPTGQLHTGQVGYVILGIKTTKAARVGDTLHLAKRPVEPLPGFRPAKSMVFAGALLWMPDGMPGHCPRENVPTAASQTLSQRALSWVGIASEAIKATDPLRYLHTQFVNDTGVGVFPLSSGDFEALAAAVERLTLNDASVSVGRETSNALGAGFRCG